MFLWHFYSVFLHTLAGIAQESNKIQYVANVDFFLVIIRQLNRVLWPNEEDSSHMTVSFHTYPLWFCVEQVYPYYAIYSFICPGI